MWHSSASFKYVGGRQDSGKQAEVLRATVINNYCSKRVRQGRASLITNLPIINHAQGCVWCGHSASHWPTSTHIAVMQQWQHVTRYALTPVVPNS